MIFLPMLLAACLFDRELYERKRAELTDADGDGVIALDDCDDDDASVFPGTPEVCDGVDQDCDGGVDEDVEDAPTWFRDEDGDGHGSAATPRVACEAPSGFVAADDDCDDTDDAVHPGAADTWYDGVDSNCDEADDYDADADGDRTEAAGGDDCDDADASIHSAANEGWLDAGIDNDCDGSIGDQVVADLDELSLSIHGSSEADALGSTLLAIPTGWVTDEPVLLAAAPFAGAGGEVYGWPAPALSESPSLSTATWTLAGDAPGDLLGFGMGWAGTMESPLLFVSAEGADDGRGVVYGWTGTAWGGEPSFVVTGGENGGYFGARILSGHDHDGDGVDDLVVTAPTDARVASNAGAVFLFLDPVSLIGGASADNADIELLTPYARALLSATSIGDADGDGREDLGLSQQIDAADGPGGLLVSGNLAGGRYDAVSVSMAQLHGGPFVFGQAADPDGDGQPELLAASGNVYRFDLPLTGTITPWDHASNELAFEDDGHYVGWLRSDLAEAAGHNAFAAASWNYEGSRGMLAIEWASWPAEHKVDEAPFLALGGQAGDLAGSSLELLDFDADGRTDFAVGAPAADPAGAGSGTVYLVPGPR